MKSDILTPRDMFQKDVRYIVPSFQRPYVWTQEKQWEPIWEDIRNIAEHLLENLVKEDTVDFSDNASRIKAEGQTSAHFLGAVVVQQQPTAAAEIEARIIIDGQQRLTTLQIILDAAQEVCERIGAKSEARRLRRLVLNDQDAIRDDLNNSFKIWPSAVDQEAFLVAMTNGADNKNHSDSLIVQAHEYFQLQIQQFLEGPEIEIPHKAEALATALISKLHVVVIDLGIEDDEHVIFETLNARGTPLLASDLIRNFTLSKVKEAGASESEFVKIYWNEFDSTWWREEITQGRIVRPRIDTFLNYWIIMETLHDINASSVFSEFRALLDNKHYLNVVESLMAYSRIYKSLIDGFREDLSVTIFLERWQRLQLGVITPILLTIFGKYAQDNDNAQLHRALNAVESFFMRRLVCRGTTKDYNRLALDLLESITSSPKPYDQAIIDFLLSQTADSREWPTDLQVKEALQKLPLYRLLNQSRLRIVLEGIEGNLRSSKSEQSTAPTNLTLEHLMPQQWHTYWELHTATAEEAPAATLRRDELLQTLGNLTLLTAKLNSSVSNGSWTTKIRALEEHSVLFLNRNLEEFCVVDSWDEDAIAARGTFLADNFCKHWVRPISVL